MSILERRLKSPGTGIALPTDYTTIVEELFANHFEKSLETLKKESPSLKIMVMGSIHSNEILLSVSFYSEGAVAATTFHSSVDFDPAASSPKAEELLGTCVDALGSVMTPYLDFSGKEKTQHRDFFLGPKFPDDLVVPQKWTEIPVERRTVFIRVDKMNPRLELEAESWLNDHDPKRRTH